ncbi:DegT/DnrJ/EryC1/StrS family aminotransferase, partial [Salmonella enterica subsp. enterica serovar Alachua]|nr:DegT/DnrJ/EryC1/StrS family aminotransferase [Salmonella enterica subsp. enterica serovar Alachua]EKQ1533481.1 DegT/DnrJ/EryC1/StrS family aminotransferase [Salmonella enterica]
MITYPLASNTWDENEYAAIQSVIDSKMFTMGKNVELYEKNFADLFGSKYAVMVSSGSTANLLMIAALFFTHKPKLKRGDEIIVPAVSWSTTYYPLQQYGLKVKFVDINKETLNIDVDSLKNAISDKTRAILAVNLLGNPNDFSTIHEIISNKDIILLEDNCESMGATFQNKQAGTFGIMGSFSSFYSHHIATMEGGCVVTDDEELYHILLCLRAHGWTRNLPKENMVTGTKSDDIFEESFKFVLPGYNVRPLEMSGAIGIEQLKKLPGFISTRRSNAQYFVDKFKDHPFLDIQKEIGESSWFGFSLIIKQGTGIERKSLINKLITSGIECRPIVTGNFLKNKRVLSYFDYSVHDTVVNAEYIDKNGFFVGNHQIPLLNEIDFLRK